MVHCITEGVGVSVETFYQMDQSNVLSNEFIFAYRITIVNYCAVPIKLINRHWHIFDSNGTKREVEGEGVVGMQPILEPNEKFQYVSAVNLRTEMGKMYGTYVMENAYDKNLFKVKIPEFNLIVDSKNN